AIAPRIAMHVRGGRARAVTGAEVAVGARCGVRTRLACRLVIEPLAGSSEIGAWKTREALAPPDVGAAAVERRECGVEKLVARLEHRVEIGAANRELICAREGGVVHDVDPLEISELVHDCYGDAPCQQRYSGAADADQPRCGSRAVDGLPAEKQLSLHTRPPRFVHVTSA